MDELPATNVSTPTQNFLQTSPPILGSKLAEMARSSTSLFPNPAPDLAPASTPDQSTDLSPGRATHRSPHPDPQASAPAIPGWVIAHCDGGARGNPGPAGYGALLQAESGAVLAELSEFLGNRTNNFAEYSGLLGCLQWALDHGCRSLRVVSDSELMVKQIQGRYKVNSPDLRPLWEEARRRIAQLDRFEISHALRHKNKHADRLANDAMDRGTGHPGARQHETRGREAQTTQHQPLGSGRRTAGPALSSPTPMPSSPPNPSRSSSISSTLSSPQPSMLRGFTRNGAVHLLGNAVLPDGIFVKIIPE